MRVCNVWHEFMCFKINDKSHFENIRITTWHSSHHKRLEDSNQQTPGVYQVLRAIPFYKEISIIMRKNGSYLTLCLLAKSSLFVL